MRRSYVILLAILLLPQLAKAQVSFDSSEGCLNEINITAGKGSRKIDGGNIISVHYLHERFINEQFCVGVGVGYSYLGSYEFSAIPVFFSSHYFFLDQRSSPFVSLRTGVYWPIGSKSKQTGANLYVAPNAGLKIHITPHVGILASASYEAYLVRTSDSVRSNMTASLGVSVSLCFQIPGW